MENRISSDGSEAREVAVLIVSFRAPDKLAACLTSVETHLPACKVFVWDNSGLEFAGIRKLAEDWPNVFWTFSPDNIGFAAGVNRLAEMAPDSDLLLLNPDALLLNSLKRTVGNLRQPGVAAAGPLDAELCASAALPRKSGPRMQWDTSYKKLTHLNFFGGATGLEYKLRGTAFSYRYRSQPRDVSGFLSGCCLLISRDAWNSIGQFDEEFYLYQEEADWQRRAIDSGWTIRLSDEIGMRHESKGTVIGDAVRSVRSEDLAFAGAVLMGERCFGVRTAELYIAWVCLLRKVKSIVSRRRPSRCDVVVTGDQDGNVAPAILANAARLADTGASVAVVSLGPLGKLPQNLPPSVRLLRRPWWCPSLGPQRARLIVKASESTRKERMFVELYRLIHRNTIQLDADELGRYAV